MKQCTLSGFQINNNLKILFHCTDELLEVHGRISEKGIDIQTERKIATWQRNVKSEIHQLHLDLQRMKSRGDDDSLYNSQHATMIKEFHDM